MRRRSRGEHGSALVEFSWLAIVLMVPLLYIVLTVFEVQKAAFATTSSARSAARAFTLAPSEAVAVERARAAALLALQDQGLGDGRGDLDITCRPSPSNCLAPGSVVTVVARYAVPLPLLPSALGAHRPSVRVEAEHTIPYGTYREDRS